jgi:hypothetical protein
MSPSTIAAIAVAGLLGAYERYLQRGRPDLQRDGGGLLDERRVVDR